MGATASHDYTDPRKPGDISLSPLVEKGPSGQTGYLGKAEGARNSKNCRLRSTIFYIFSVDGFAESGLKSIVSLVVVERISGNTRQTSNLAVVPESLPGPGESNL